MTLFGTLFSSVSGLTSQSRWLSMISDNIANVNTVGYKGAVAEFSSLVTQSSNSLTYAPGGVRAISGRDVEIQGLVQSSNSPTDAAVSGKGFFVVNALADGSGEQLYTRAGAFSTDYLGNLKTPSGFYLQGWALDADGNIVDVNQLETVNIRTLTGLATATTRIDVGANLNSEQTAAAAYTAGDMYTYFTSGGTSGLQPHFRRDIRIFDSFGAAHTVTLAFAKTGGNTWAVELYTDLADLDGTVHTTGLLGSGTMTFNGDGSYNTVTGTIASPIATTWANGSQNGSLTMGFGTSGETDGMTQFASESDVAYIQQNGAEVGKFSSVKIDEDGYVIASFTNGAQRKIFRLPLATFPNPEGLDLRSGNVFAETDVSGEYTLRFANSGNAGRVVPSALEMANVDLADEFTKMIVTQRAYTANARVITTVNDMLNELMQISR